MTFRSYTVNRAQPSSDVDGAKPKHLKAEGGDDRNTCERGPRRNEE